MQRICDDVASFVELSVFLVMTFIKQIFNCVAFAGTAHPLRLKRKEIQSSMLGCKLLSTIKHRYDLEPFTIQNPTLYCPWKHIGRCLYEYIYTPPPHSHANSGANSTSSASITPRLNACLQEFYGQWHHPWCSSLLRMPYLARGSQPLCSGAA